MYYLFIGLCRPFLLLFLAVLVTLFILWRRRVERTGRLLCVIVPMLLLYLYCMPFFSNYVVGSLEWKYLKAKPYEKNAQAIVVFGGGIHAPIEDFGIEAELAESSIYRCLKAVEVAKRNPELRVYVCGGRVHADRPGPTIAEAMRDFMLDHGIHFQRIVLENESKTTYENAKNVAEMLREQNIEEVILVTEATHMYRSRRCLEKQRIVSVPLCSNYRAATFEWSPLAFLPSAQAAADNQDVFHEYLGLFWYWFHDRI